MTNASDSAESLCPHCAKPDYLCLCDSVEPIDNRVMLVVLQHPQEQDRLLGSARLACRYCTNSLFRIGLSWPSLSKVLGREADPSEWAVLHLGALRGSDLPPDREVIALDKKGVPYPDQDERLAKIKGIILFDGTWSQAKTLWWRNAWTLKAQRLALNPKAPSLYGKLRREPRREGLSTLEAAALTLSRLESRPEIEDRLREGFSIMLARYRAAVVNHLIKPEAKIDRRRRSSRGGKSTKPAQQ